MSRNRSLGRRKRARPTRSSQGLWLDCAAFSRSPRSQADVAQLVEQLIRNQQVAGSNPAIGSSKDAELCEPCERRCGAGEAAGKQAVPHVAAGPPADRLDTTAVACAASRAPDFPRRRTAASGAPADSSGIGLTPADAAVVACRRSRAGLFLYGAHAEAMEDAEIQREEEQDGNDEYNPGSRRRVNAKLLITPPPKWIGRTGDRKNKRDFSGLRTNVVTNPAPHER